MIDIADYPSRVPRSPNNRTRLLRPQAQLRMPIITPTSPLIYCAGTGTIVEIRQPSVVRIANSLTRNS